MKFLYSKNDYGNGNRYIIQPENQLSPTRLLHFAENVTCGPPVGSQTTLITVTQSTVHETSRQSSSIPESLSSSQQTFKSPSFKQRATVLPTKPQLLSTRPSTTKTTRQTTRRSITTRRPRITFISRRPTLIVTQQSKKSRAEQITSRITRNQTVH